MTVFQGVIASAGAAKKWPNGWQFRIMQAIYVNEGNH